MITNYICHIIHATITDFDIVAIEDLVIFMISSKMFRNVGFKILLNGGLYQMMFLPLFLLSRVYCSFSNVSFPEYPHLSKMSL